jgi:ATP-dependent DNA helicase RecG
MMQEATEEAGLVPPEFEERGGEIVVRFRPTRYVAPRRVEHDLSDLQQQLLQIVGREGPVAISDIEQRLDTEAARRTVQKHLNVLREMELVEMKGRKGGAQWQVTEE